MNTLIDRHGLPKSMAGPLAKAATELARVTTMSSKEAYERIVRAVGYELADWKCRQATGGYGLGPREPIPPQRRQRMNTDKSKQEAQDKAISDTLEAMIEQLRLDVAALIRTERTVDGMSDAIRRSKSYCIVTPDESCVDIPAHAVRKIVVTQRDTIADRLRGIILPLLAKIEGTLHPRQPSEVPPVGVVALQCPAISPPSEDSE